jgi:hypothetical protein
MKLEGATKAFVAASTVLALIPVARAVEYEVGEGMLSIRGSAYIGAAMRTDKQDPELLPNVNSSKVGIAGKAVSNTAGRNQDDGNLNFNRGDPVSEAVKGYLTLEYKWQNYGAVASAKAWYDYALAKGDVPWGNYANGYTPGQALSDAGAITRSRFGGVALDNLYGYGKNEFDGITLDWILGNQKLHWGNRYLVFGGLQDLNPLDIPATLRPGTVRFEETRIAFPAAFARVALPNKATSIEGFYQFQFQRNAPSQCGTFFSQLDFVAEGCEAAFLAQNLADPQLLAADNYVKRAATQMPSNAGQGGVAIRHVVEDWATEFGFYAAQFHSRSSFYSAIKGTNPAATPYIPGSPRNAQYFTEYPEEIQMYALTFDSKIRGGAVFGELSYRPNQPFQYNSADLLAAFTSATAPTPLRAQANATAPGATFNGWERLDALQLQLGAAGTLPGVLGAAALTFGGEVVYKLVPDLPDPSVTRFGRSDVFGQGPVNGVCPVTNNMSVSCTYDGYVSKTAFGYRLRGALQYRNVISGVLDLTPSLSFAHDVSGWSGDGAILEGRMLAVAALNASFSGGWTGTIAWAPTWGGTYNNLRDRSIAQAYVGYKF